jgi:hypothetical protein
MSRISYTSSRKLDELPTDLDTRVLGSIRIKKQFMHSHYQPDRFKSSPWGVAIALITGMPALREEEKLFPSGT